ncbi:uncharacterized protein LY79DRAFT_151999 [Colletotrichum navitas]|uniref:Uncharacterized protein n=1 Tax=Colletotrichum navitas TaxID=681940 RepID=A0AAD8QBV4_9PEZI|nr:uncharacterized protein LY79DRAFT_151999 [Colletotrichum navitas]KAK1599798.1 hypothetical protein LY79DRAFT_151999 [Colletotrichum navitas]
MARCCIIPGTAEHVGQNKPNLAIRLYIPFWDLWGPSPPRDRTQRDCTGLQPTPTSSPLPPGATTRQRSSCVDHSERDWGGEVLGEEGNQGAREGISAGISGCCSLGLCDISSVSTPRMNA